MVRAFNRWICRFDPAFPFTMFLHLGLLALMFVLTGVVVGMARLLDVEISDSLAIAFGAGLALALVAEAVAVARSDATAGRDAAASGTTPAPAAER